MKYSAVFRDDIGGITPHILTGREKNDIKKALDSENENSECDICYGNLKFTITKKIVNALDNL